MRIAVVALVLAFLCGAAWAQDDGMPFGKMDDSDVNRLGEFARASDFDLLAEAKRAYEKDEDALGRLFRFSLAFKSLDPNARAYGQIIYSSWLNLGESIGLDWYLAVLDRQPSDAQQRVRDFLYYAFTVRIPKERRKEAEAEFRKDYPRLFPLEFQFGRDDPVFAKGLTDR